MSRIFKCDRCGSTYDQHAAERPTYYAAGKRIPADLRPDCTASLTAWFQHETEQVIRCGDCAELRPNGYCGYCNGYPDEEGYCWRGKRRKEGAPE